MKKKRVAFFDFTCCEGCQLQVANIGEVLLDVLGLVDVVTFREVMSEKSEDYDIAVVEGSITTPHDAERLKGIREKAGVIIAYGSCAAIGGVNGMKSNFELDDIRKYVYGDKAEKFETVRTLALSQVVKVDYVVRGCPVYPPEFLKILKSAVQGIPYEAKDEAVCVECKMNENECMFDKGLTCLGPVTKAGCNSWCVNSGNICYGCRGLVREPVRNGCMEVLKKHNIPLEWVTGKLDMYNKTLEAEENVKK
jgi:sulfhydrogenase subunit delta